MGANHPPLFSHQPASTLIKEFLEEGLNSISSQALLSPSVIHQLELFVKTSKDPLLQTSPAAKQFLEINMSNTQGKKYVSLTALKSPSEWIWTGDQD